MSLSDRAGSTPGNAPAARVLVVDDDPDIRMSVQGVLEDEGLVVDVAHDRAEALVCAARHRPTMVVLDINLPDGPGWEVASQLRAQHGAGLWILAITADGSAARKAREVGAFAYLRKPFEMTHLVDLVFGRLADS